jgi:CDP-diglyceride synthetase
MIIFASFLIILCVALILTWIKTEEIETMRFNLESSEIINLASNAINTAYLEGDGYMQNLTLPDNILDLQYSIFISSNIITINHSLGTLSGKLLTENIIGNLIPGTNTIENRNNVIFINS